MTAELPQIITLAAESGAGAGYDNHPIAELNDHVVRISTMTTPYHWHFHPDSDETFLVIAGRLAIDFEAGTIELGPGQLATVPRGVRHRTRPVGERSIYTALPFGSAALPGEARHAITVTFERANAQSIAAPEPESI